MKNKFALLIMASLLTFTACTSSTGTTTNQGTEPVETAVETQTTEIAEDSPAPAEDGTLGGKYKVEFGNAEKTTSEYESGDLIMITYTFTNNSDEATSADIATMLTAYQDGVEIEQAFDSSITGDNASKKIETGASLECKALFKLSSASDVEIEATEFCGLDDSKVTKTYTIQ